MSIVIGIDQHRAQITAEWIELATGEIRGTRVRPRISSGAPVLEAVRGPAVGGRAGGDDRLALLG
ncbi:MAG TPA: hypothetical protein VEN29_05930 [Casimicrobiaceae bacterium]|nr:hypothetical protein [Casimicrobiaceae bacterium]